jgi:hypothetical protein
MFPVQPETVRALFDAQTEPNRRKLRLDVSSRTCPGDLTSDYELPAAQVAVAERFLRSLAGYVDEVAVGEAFAGFRRFCAAVARPRFLSVASCDPRIGHLRLDRAGT